MYGSLANKPVVSIIMPVYNGEQYIDEAICSILSQTFKNFELIVVDDGSSDKTRELVSAWCIRDVRIRYFFQKNRGVSAARNKGINVSLGEFIAFIDQDDVWLSKKLEECIQYLLQGKYSMVYSDMILINGDGEAIDQWLPKKKYSAEGLIYKNLLTQCFIVPSTVVVTRKVLEEAEGFDENISNVEDLDLWLRIAARHEIGLVTSPLVKWRWHESNASKNIEKNLVNLIKLFEKHAQLFKNNKELSFAIRSKWAEKNYSLGRFYFENGSYKKSRQFFINSRIRPFFVQSFFFQSFSYLPASLINIFKLAKRFKCQRSA